MVYEPEFIYIAGNLQVDRSRVRVTKDLTNYRLTSYGNTSLKEFIAVLEKEAEGLEDATLSLEYDRYDEYSYVHLEGWRQPTEDEAIKIAKAWEKEDKRIEGLIEQEKIQARRAREDRAKKERQTYERLKKKFEKDGN